MEKSKMEEYISFLRSNANRYKDLSDRSDGSVGMKAHERAEAYDHALRQFRAIVGSPEDMQPAPPAESPHEMAKRMCDTFEDCDGCPIDCGFLSCVVGTYAALTDDEMDVQEETMRKWAAENPPKPALTGVCALCSNAEVACGNCVHNPRNVDHFHAVEKP